MYRKATDKNTQGYELVKNDDKITLVVNYNMDNQKVKEYTIPKYFSQVTVDLFDKRLDNLTDDLQTLNIFMNGYHVTTFDELAGLYKWLNR